MNDDRSLGTDGRRFRKEVGGNILLNEYFGGSPAIASHAKDARFSSLGERF
jgi:hypothetical protein